MRIGIFGDIEIEERDKKAAKRKIIHGIRYVHPMEKRGMWLQDIVMLST